MGKKTRKEIKKLTEAVEDLREQNEELSRQLTEALQSQTEEIRALARTLESRPDTPDGEVPDASEEEDEPEATEAAGRRAEELGIDLSEIKGTGAGGRILVRDVEEAAGTED